MRSKKKPTVDFLKDLKGVFDKHNWSGSPIGISTPSATTATTPCPDGTKPHKVVIHHSDGTISIEIRCW